MERPPQQAVTAEEVKRHLEHAAKTGASSEDLKKLRKKLKRKKQQEKKKGGDAAGGGGGQDQGDEDWDPGDSSSQAMSPPPALAPLQITAGAAGRRYHAERVMFYLSVFTKLRLLKRYSSAFRYTALPFSDKHDHSLLLHASNPSVRADASIKPPLLSGRACHMSS